MQNSNSNSMKNQMKEINKMHKSIKQIMKNMENGMKLIKQIEYEELKKQYYKKLDEEYAQKQIQDEQKTVIKYDSYFKTRFVENWVDSHYQQYSNEYDYDLHNWDYCIECAEIEYEIELIRETQYNNRYVILK